MNHQKNIALSQSETKYKNMRLMILTLFVLSIINCVSLALIDTFFYFSAYFPFILIVEGYSLAVETGAMIFYIVFCILALISIIPYILCYIFSKKHVGWMIAALALISVDSILMLIDLIYAPDGFMVVNFAFHVYMVVTLALGVKYGFDVKKEKAAEAAAQASDLPVEEAFIPQADGTYAYVSDSTLGETTRSITVTRKKSFVGCAIPFVVYINNQQVAVLKNGQSATFEATGAGFKLRAGSTNGLVVGDTLVPAGDDNAAYEISVKMGVVTNSLVINRVG